MLGETGEAHSVSLPQSTARAQASPTKGAAEEQAEAHQALVPGLRPSEAEEGLIG